MKTNLFNLVLLLLYCFVPALGQDVPVLSPGDLPGMVIDKTEFYAGQSLFGYIDGGAELYLEYGFQKLGRQEVRYSDENLIAEIYRMRGPLEAYGVFSIQRFRCTPVDSLMPNTCVSKYQLQAALGDCYVNIVNESGTPAARQAGIKILRRLAARIPAQKLDLPAMFSGNHAGLRLQDLLVAFGPLGVQNGFAEWEPMFRNLSKFVVAILPIEEEPSEVVLAYVAFDSPPDLEEFCAAAGMRDASKEGTGTWVNEGATWTARRAGTKELSLLKTPTPFPGRERFLRLIEGDADSLHRMPGK